MAASTNEEYSRANQFNSGISVGVTRKDHFLQKYIKITLLNVLAAEIFCKYKHHFPYIMYIIKYKWYPCPEKSRIIMLEALILYGV